MPLSGREVVADIIVSNNKKTHPEWGGLFYF